MTMFTKAFWVATLENVVQGAASAFTGSLFFTSGNPTLKNLAVGGIAAGVAALYTFSKALGAQQLVTALQALQAQQEVTASQPVNK